MYAKLNRIAICLALCAAALGGVSVAHAGYAQLAPPAGFGTVGGGFGYAAAANDSVFGRVIHQPAGLTANVGGQAVKMPAAYRLAANAPRIAAQAIFLHPGVRTAVGIAAWLGAAGLIWDAVNGKWTTLDEDQVVSSGKEWSPGLSPITYYPSPEAACSAAIGGSNVGISPESQMYVVSCQVLSNNKYALTRKSGQTWEYSFSVRNSSCPAGWYVTPAGCLQTPNHRVLTQEEAVELLNPSNQPGWPMPSTVPQELPPGTLLPVEQPFINPVPGPSPAHRPQFVPTGNPVPNPNYDPNQAPGPANQPYLQPGVRIVPSPTPSNPWQVDMQPVDRPVGSADPNPDPQPDPEPGDGDKPKPEDQQSLCEKHPDILACSKPELDTPEDEIPRETRDVSYQPESLFGGGVCPSNKTMSTHGLQLTVWDWQESCGYITGYFRPVILVLCAFAAFVIVSGGARQS